MIWWLIVAGVGIGRFCAGARLGLAKSRVGCFLLAEGRRFYAVRQKGTGRQVVWRLFWIKLIMTRLVFCLVFRQYFFNFESALSELTFVSLLCFSISTTRFVLFFRFLSTFISIFFHCAIFTVSLSFLVLF